MIKIWDISYDEEIDHIQGHKGEVVSMHYNPEFPSKMISGGAYPDDTIKIWDRYTCISAFSHSRCKSVLSSNFRMATPQRVGVAQQPARARTNLET